MTYPDYALSVRDISRGIQREFEALGGAVLKVPQSSLEPTLHWLEQRAASLVAEALRSRVGGRIGIEVHPSS